jgi:hypothetical protein
LSKKDRLFGASAAISFNSDTNVPNNQYPDQHSNNIAFMPSFAWVIKNNLTMGIKGNFSYVRIVGKSTAQKSVYTTLQAGPEIFIRKYKTLIDRFGVFFNHGLDVHYTRQTGKFNQDFSKTTTWGGGYNFTPGAFYKFSERFLGEATFGGLALDYSNNAGMRSFNAGVSFLSYLNVGVQYIIPGKKS